MKRVTLILTNILVISKLLLGQEPLKYSEVVQVDSIPKNELFNRAKIWFVTTYHNAKEVLQLENQEEGEIVGKAIIKYYPNVFAGSEQIIGNINYTIKIFVKDGRYKYEITDFIHDPYGNQLGLKTSMGLITTDIECPYPQRMGKNWSKKVWKDIKSQIESNITLLIFSLKQGMNKTTESKSEDW